MYWDGAHWWAWLPMSVFMIAVWGLLVWGIIRLLTDRRPGGPHRPTALEILDERLARGEIDVDEHRERRTSLEGSERSRRPAGAKPE